MDILTIDKVQKGEEVIVIENEVVSAGTGWSKIRTQNGKIGYVKTNKLTNHTTVRETAEETKQITGKVNMFWDYYSKYVQAPRLPYKSEFAANCRDGAVP